MLGLRLLALCAALAGQGGAAHATGGPAALAADSGLLAQALSGPALQLTMRGTTVVVTAVATPAEDGCAAMITAHAPGSDRKWSRLFRWSELAWAGSKPDGATMVSFFEEEGRLAADTLVFSPADGASFRAALARLAASCRTNRGEAERVTIGSQGGARGCYFAALPGLHLLGSVPPPSARAVLTVLGRETPQAELQLLLERRAPGAATAGDDWASPSVAFIFADPGLADMRIAKAAFALDNKTVTAQHSVTAFGETRLRISMDPFGPPVNGAAGFYRRLAASGEVALTLLDDTGQSRAVLNFDAGPALSAARRALAASDWSCAGSSASPAPAARWEARS
jgi:hypothetical protein